MLQIPTPYGKYLVMIVGYTYSQMRDTTLYYCSKKNVGCKARVKINEMGQLIFVSPVAHTHPRPKYVLTSDGKYVKISN